MRLGKQDSYKQIVRGIKFHIWIILFWSRALLQKYDRDDIFLTREGKNACSKTVSPIFSYAEVLSAV